MASGKKVADAVFFECKPEGEDKEKRFTLRLTPSAWIELEDAGLGNVQTLVEKLEDNPSFKTFVTVFAAALRGGMKDKGLSDETALDIADEVGSERVISLIGDCVQASFPETSKIAKAGNGKPPPRPKS